MQHQQKFPRRAFLTGVLAAGGICLIPGSASAHSKGIYKVDSKYSPTRTGGVSQQLVSETPAYKASNASNWWVCGHAALLTAINYMRQGTISDSHKITQLQWLHERLVDTQKGYAASQHKEADIDALGRVMKDHKAEEFAIRKVSSLDRATVRDELLATLREHSCYAVALTQTKIGDTIFGHYVAIDEIDYRPETEQGGTVYYWDPYLGRRSSMGFSTLINGMHDAIAVGRHSFLRLYRK